MMTDWTDAACRGIDPNRMVFEIQYHGGRIAEGTQLRIDSARALCATCPPETRQRCLDDELDVMRRDPHIISVGIRGGTIPVERKKIIHDDPQNTRRSDPILHGTIAGYRVHLRRPEAGPPCTACKTVYASFRSATRPSRAKDRLGQRGNAGRTRGKGHHGRDEETFADLAQILPAALTYMRDRQAAAVAEATALRTNHLVYAEGAA